MVEDYEKKRQKQASLFRAILDFAMGVVMIGLGAVMFFHQDLNLPVNERFSPGMVKTLGVIIVVYGIWRLYKGYKKNYSQ